jgi:hypothetical protein
VENHSVTKALFSRANETVAAQPSPWFTPIRFIALSVLLSLILLVLPGCGGGSDVMPEASWHTVNGKVVDAESGAPLADVAVTYSYRGKDGQVITGDDGVFVIDGLLSADVLRLNLKCRGYDTRRDVSITAVPQGRQSGEQIEMTESPVWEIEEFTEDHRTNRGESGQEQQKLSWDPCIRTMMLNELYEKADLLEHFRGCLQIDERIRNDDDRLWQAVRKELVTYAKAAQGRFEITTSDSVSFIRVK